jgi:hypothetical protein
LREGSMSFLTQLSRAVERRVAREGAGTGGGLADVGQGEGERI